MAECKGCGSFVKWVPNVSTGKRAQVDPYPVDGGNVVRAQMPDGSKGYRVLTKAEMEGDDPATFPRYVLHFVTCTRAEHFRSCRTCHHTPCKCVKDPT